MPDFEFTFFTLFILIVFHPFTIADYLALSAPAPIPHARRVSCSCISRRFQLIASCIIILTRPLLSWLYLIVNQVCASHSAYTYRRQWCGLRTLGLDGRTRQSPSRAGGTARSPSSASSSTSTTTTTLDLSVLKRAFT